MKCKECGFSKLNEDAKSCFKCGALLSVGNNQPSHVLVGKTTFSTHNVETKNNELIELPTNNGVFDSSNKNTRVISKKVVEQNEQPTPLTIDHGKVEDERKNRGIYQSKGTQMIGDFDYKKELNLKFELVPLGEKSEKPLKFYSDDEQLKRSSIDNDDLTISSSNHVKIFKEGNSWKIKNLSSNGALFLRIIDESEIHENDIIIIGKNKTFLFKPK